jgi:putative flippase GtrA
MQFGWSKASLELGRLVRFGLVGVVATAVYSVVALLAIQGLDLSPIFGSALGCTASIAVSYYGHTLYSFRVEINHAAFLWRFLSVAAASFIIATGVMWLLTDLMDVSYLLSVGIIAVLVPITNYVCNRFWIFRPGL